MRPTLLLALLMVAPAVLPSSGAVEVPALLSVTEGWTGVDQYLRDPAVAVFRGKLYTFWEGDDPGGAWPGYHGYLYYRTYEDLGGLASFSDVPSLTPTVSPFEGEHRNEKLFPIVFKDRLHAIWSSSDRAQVPGGNVGWVEILASSFDGEKWGENFQLNAPVEPYNLSRRGANQHPHAAVLGERLYVVWERNVQHEEDGVSLFYSDIWMRSFDGESWDAPVKVSGNTTTEYSEGPAVGAFGDRLCVAWETVDFRDPARWKWELRCRWLEDGAFGPVVTIASSTDSGFKDSYPRLQSFRNPATARDEFYAFWRVTGIPPGQSEVRASIAYSVHDGTTWSEPRDAAPPARFRSASGMGKMSVLSHEGRIFVTWATTDDAITYGQDFDIAIRSFDGEGWGPITEVTMASDESLPDPWDVSSLSRPKALDPSGLPTGWNPLTDWRPERVRLDNDPRLVEYQDRLYVCWRMIPDFRYYGHMIIFFKVVEDGDADGDGRPDTEDWFPVDPADWADADGDGAGDNTDPSPFDPDIWRAGQRAAGPAGENPAGPLVVILLVGSAGAYFLRPSKRDRS